MTRGRSMSVVVDAARAGVALRGGNPAGRAMPDTRLIRYDVADPQAGGQRRPFARAVRAGDFVFVSGQVPTVGGEVVAGGIVAQTEQVIANLRARARGRGVHARGRGAGDLLARRPARLLLVQRGLREAFHRRTAGAVHRAARR